MHLFCDLDPTPSLHFSGFSKWYLWLLLIDFIRAWATHHHYHDSSVRFAPPPLPELYFFYFNQSFLLSTRNNTEVLCQLSGGWFYYQCQLRQQNPTILICQAFRIVNWELRNGKKLCKTRKKAVQMYKIWSDKILIRRYIPSQLTWLFFFFHCVLHFNNSIFLSKINFYFENAQNENMSSITKICLVLNTMSYFLWHFLVSRLRPHTSDVGLCGLVLFNLRSDISNEDWSSLNYKATDIGSRSIVGSHVPGEGGECEWCIRNELYMTCSQRQWLYSSVG